MPLPFFGLGVAAIGTRAQQLRGRDRRLLEERHAESARFQSLVEHLPVATYIDSLDNPAVTLYMSDQIEELTGFSSEEFRSDPQLWRARVPEPHRVVSDAAFARHRETGEPLSCEHPFLRRDGRRIWLVYRARVVTSEEGRGLFSEGVVFDVTESKEREKPLLRRLEILGATFEGSPNGSAILLPGGGIVRANPAMEEMLGFSAHELHAMSFRDLVDPELAPEKAARLEQTLRGEAGSRQCELYLIGKDGRRVRGRVTILRAAENQVDGSPLLCAVVEDVTERRRVEDESRRAAEQLRAIISNLPVILWTVDQDGVFDMFEGKGLDDFSTPRETFLGSSAFELFGQGHPEVVSAIRSALNGEDEHLIIPADVGEQWWETWYSPIRDRRGEVMGALGVTLDITEQVGKQHQVLQSLSLLNATFDSIADGIIAIDHEGDRILDYNRRVMEIWAIPEEMLATRSAALVREHIFAQSKDQEWLRRVTMEVLADPERESHHMIELLDGRIIERRIVPQRVDGRVVGRVASYRDVTQERRATSLLLDEARILEAVARDVPLAEVLDDLCRTVERYATDAVCSVLLLSENDMLAFAAGPSLEWFHRQIGPVPVADGAGSCGTAAYTGEAVICEDVRADPRWADYVEAADAHDLRSAWSIPVKASGGSVIGTFALYHRTPRRPSEDELRVVEVSASLAAVAIERDVALRQRLALEDRIRQSEKMESVGRLAGGVAHDLGNVLSAVTLNCDLLRYEVTSEPGKESLRDLEVAAGMAGRLVDDLLNLMRPPNPRVVDLNSLVGEMASLLESVVQESVRVQVELEASPSLAQIDPDQIRQVLLNLVVNAKEAMPEGGTVFVRTANPKLSTITGTRDHVILTVTDSGIGMDPETQQRAFEPFFTTKRGPGTKGVGLGLASGHAAVTQVGGDISLLSWPGKGTVVTISLPRAGERGDPNG